MSSKENPPYKWGPGRPRWTDELIAGADTLERLENATVGTADNPLAHEPDERPGAGGRGAAHGADVGPSCLVITRTQAFVLSFFGVAWLSLLIILMAAPEVYDEALRIGPNHPVAELSALVAIGLFVAILATGVLRRWRWTFWLTLVAFLGGALRLPASVLQATGVLETDLPTWYVVFQGLLGVVQLGIGLLMLRGYRKAGMWEG